MGIGTHTTVVDIEILLHAWDQRLKRVHAIVWRVYATHTGCIHTLQGKPPCGCSLFFFFFFLFFLDRPPGMQPVLSFTYPDLNVYLNLQDTYTFGWISMPTAVVDRTAAAYIYQIHSILHGRRIAQEAFCQLPKRPTIDVSAKWRLERMSGTPIEISDRLLV
eukprot:scpid51624/ scgid31088/ 